MKLREEPGHGPSRYQEVKTMNATQKEWLDKDGRFLFGKFRNRAAEDVVQTDPSYIGWILDTVEDIDSNDRQILRTLLRRKPSSRL